MFKHILFPTEYSEFSIEAMNFTLDMVQLYHAKLSILYIIPDYGMPAVEDYFPTTGKHEDKKEPFEKFKEKLKRHVPQSVPYNIITITGRPFESILFAAEELKNDLIVLASRNKKGIVHHLIGTNSGKVAKRANCSVILVKPETMHMAD